MKHADFYRKTLSSLLGTCLLFAGAQASAAQFDISNIPLVVNESVPPNLIFTLDDSSSMRSTYVPDSPAYGTTTRQFRSSFNNPLYYNPEITYQVPRKFDANGNEIGKYETSFTKAWFNGYRPQGPSRNLGNNYAAVTSFSPLSNTDTLNDTLYTGIINTDFGATASVPYGSPPASVSIGGVVIQLARPSKNSQTCTIISSGYEHVELTSCTLTLSNDNITVRLSPAANSYNTKRPAYYYVYNSTVATTTDCDKFPEKCYRLVIVGSKSGINGRDERENFAIWYSFYRSRAMATLTAARLAFSDMSSSIRLTWQGLTDCRVLNGGPSGQCGDNKFRVYSPAQRGRFFTWLDSVSFPGNTPLRQAMSRAGQFLTTPVAWHKYPNSSEQNTAENTYSCRPSYHLLMTDGFWNSTDGTSTKADHTDITLPDGQQYRGRSSPTNEKFRPYADKTLNTLADVAMHYWATDLTNLGDNVPPYIPYPNNDKEKEYWDPRNNPATWQHMVNFTMGLGLSASLNKRGLEWDEEKGTYGSPGYLNIANGTQAWPAAATSHINNVYDLWHAAVNSRGEFFSAEDPEGLIRAFKDILGRISDQVSTSTNPAVGSSQVSDGISNTLYTTQFSSENWSGEIIKSVDNQILWNSKNKNTSTLKKVMMKGNNGKLANFSWNNLSATQQEIFNTNPDDSKQRDNLGEKRVAYINGDRSNEGTAENQFRVRTTIIGDIVNSSPALVGIPNFVSAIVDAVENPGDSSKSYESYGKFRSTNKNRDHMLYVGANDGMLHGIDVETGISKFAFIPTEVIKNLPLLTGKKYNSSTTAGHRFFVDGSPIVRDVYMGQSKGWRTVLIGTLRAGGKALFALDVTNPNNIELLWEFDAQENTAGKNGDPDLGYTFARPEIARLHTGAWAVLMGNGYNSTHDRAALLVIDIEKGTLLKKLLLPEIKENGMVLPNGLSSVRATDHNGDGIADYAYAGDIQGNLWRFHLQPESGTLSRLEIKTISAEKFDISYGRQPLFTARDSTHGKRQPITVQPSLVRHPTGVGYLVVFGTGKYFETSDASLDIGRAMTLYGIWDRKAGGQSTTASDTGASLNNLAEQNFTSEQKNVTFTNDGDSSGTHSVRLLSQNPISWYNNNDTVQKWGWKLDLKVNNKNTGEMIVNDLLISGKTLFVSSLSPSSDPCAGDVSSWLYAIDATTGGRTRYTAFDLNNDGKFDKNDNYSDSVVSGIQVPSPGFVIAPGNTLFTGDGTAIQIQDDPGERGRQNWYIVPEEL